MDAHQINPKKNGHAVKGFALAVTPPKPEPATATGRAGRKSGGSVKAAPKGGRR